jgi:imidazole glycerol phosphate synthase glutamine amidotransferase subunit
MRIVVCDAGVGNVRSVVRAVERAAGTSVVVTPDPEAIRRADVLVVPGQGAFGSFARAMEGGLGEALVESIRRGTPYLGICLGLQVLFESSEEAPGARGLSVLPGRVRRLVVDLPLPHIGWNTVVPSQASFLGDATRHFYFAHSFVAEPADARVVAGTTDYGGSFASAIAHEQIVGVQFHPEKSQKDGLALLARFFEKKV